MRVLTLNIRFGAGSENPEKPGYDLPITTAKLAAIAAAIGGLRPDVAALQEVYNARQVERLAEMLDMRFVYVRHPSGYALDFFEWGLALLHRFETIRTTQHLVAFDPKLSSGRHALIATLRIEGQPVTFVNVHLEPGDIHRQVTNLLSATEAVAMPLAVMGDFNCQPDDDALEPVRTRWCDTCRAVASPRAREADVVGTLLHKRVRVDYVFVDPRHFIVEEAGLAKAAHRRVSDHLAYYADLQPKGLP